MDFSSGCLFVLIHLIIALLVTLMSKLCIVLSPALVAGLLLFAGCSGEDLPSMYKIAGTATFDGKPVSDLTIRFIPTAGGRESTGISDADGKFTLEYKIGIAGATVGENKVTVAWNPTDPAMASKASQKDFTPPAPYDAILKKYGNAETTTLKVNVDSNNENLELKLD